MKAREDLMGVYQQWRQLTEKEGDAIRVADWLLVSACQDAKQLLQPLIIKFLSSAQHEWVSSGLDCTTFDREVRTIVDELIGLEHRNGEMVAQQRQAAQQQAAELGQSSRILTRVHKSYTAPRTAVWHSYS